MVLLKVFLGFTLFWISDATYDLAPRERCIPTATAYGACHVCVCRLDGVYYCRAHACKEPNATTIIKERKRECKPNRTYREDATFCSCSKGGFWISNNCREKFRTMKPNTLRVTQTVETNIKCTPNSLYLVDCNICRCGQNGLIRLSSCTSRRCSRGHKVDVCSYGDFLRTNNEICSCSDINLYIDRLCLKVADTAIQVVSTSDLEPIIDIGKTWTRTNEIYLKACVPGSVVIFNCNRCSCSAGKTWGCTLKGCMPPKLDALRTKTQENGFYSLPALKSENGLCEPGKHYRYKCNSCICSKKKIPVCTTMLCLEDVVLDKKVLERSYLEQHTLDRI